MQSTKEIWDSFSKVPFDEWIHKVSDQVMSSGIGIARSALAAGAQPAEVLAVLKLAALEDSDLHALAKNVPPRTMWLGLGNASPEELMTCLKTLGETTDRQTLNSELREILSASTEQSLWESVQSVSASTLKNMAEIADDYGVLSDRALRALKNFAAMRKRGAAFTAGQVQYLKGLLETLVKEGLVTKNSPNSNQKECDEVLAALGVG